MTWLAKATRMLEEVDGLTDTEPFHSVAMANYGQAAIGILRTMVKAPKGPEYEAAWTEGVRFALAAIQKFQESSDEITQVTSRKLVYFVLQAALAVKDAPALLGTDQSQRLLEAMKQAIEILDDYPMGVAPADIQKAHQCHDEAVAVLLDAVQHEDSTK